MTATPAGWKKKFADAMAEYFTDVVYLTLLLGVFALYRRLLQAEYATGYLQYGITLVEALVLAKILLVGRMVRLDRPFMGRPLIYPTVYKALVFSLLIGAFAVLETLIKGLFEGRSAGESLGEFSGQGKYELFGKCLVTFFALIPFFGLKEVGLIMGEGKLRRAFFHGRDPSGHSGHTEERSWLAH